MLNTGPHQSVYTLLSGPDAVAGSTADDPVVVVLQKLLEPDYNAANETDQVKTVHEFAVYPPAAAVFVAVPTALLPDAERRMEFIGDSITAGYGIDARGSSECAASWLNQDYDLTYPALLGAWFNASVHVEAWSGRGLVLNTGGEEPGTSHMPEIIRRAFASQPDSPAWDPASFVPRVVWVNLGTNDYCCGRSRPIPGYQQAYTELLVNLTKQYSAVDGKKPFLFAAYGPMSSAYEPQVTAAVADAQASGCLATVVDLSDVYSHDGAVGCSGHPSALGDELMAQAGAAGIANVTGWSFDANRRPFDGF